MLRYCLYTLVGCLVSVHSGAVFAQNAEADDAALAQPSAEGQQQPVDPLRFPVGDGSLKVTIQAGAQVVAENNSFWNLSQSFAPTAGYDPDMVWGEAYLSLGAKIDQPIGKATVTLGVSAIASQTLGRDIFDQKDEGAVQLEDAYVGLAVPLSEKDSFSVTVGAQPYRVGTGLLISDGAADGFERGTVIFGPRQAWGKAGVASLRLGKFTVDAFHLNPRELSSSDTRTIINGGKIEVALGADRFAGLSFAHVPRSTAPYIQAAPGGVGIPGFIFDGRDGLSFLHGYFKVSPIASAPGFWVAGDYVGQRNSRIDLRSSAQRIEAGYAFSNAPWRPTVSYGYYRFSGDNPNTPKLERFDPLFYDGSPSGWAMGSNGSMVFINSNIRAHRLTLASMPSPQDIVTFRFSHVQADKLKSPVQFGQATRPDFDLGLPGIVAGVTSRNLSDDILIEYTRIVTQNIFVSAGLAHSWIAKGLQDLSPITSSDWTGGFVNVVFRY